MADQDGDLTFYEIFVLKILKLDIFTSIKPMTTKSGQQVHLKKLRWKAPKFGGK